MSASAVFPLVFEEKTVFLASTPSQYRLSGNYRRRAHLKRELDFERSVGSGSCSATRQTSPHNEKKGIPMAYRIQSYDVCAASSLLIGTSLPGTGRSLTKSAKQSRRSATKQGPISPLLSFTTISSGFFPSSRPTNPAASSLRGSGTAIGEAPNYSP
jgi:hypothetical protein